MTIISAHKCDIGRRRKQNEDYAWVDEQAGLYILADGMGGHEAGDVASKLAATTIGELITDQLNIQNSPLSKEDVRELMLNTIDIANTTVFNASQEAGQLRHMGTTVVIALIQSSTAYISHVGDSRAYLVHNSTLQQLTEDDTWGAKLVQEDQEVDNQVQGHLSHILTQAVGQETTPTPSFTTVELTPETWLILCSDGLWNMVKDEQTLTSVQQAKNNPARAVETLVNAANAAGGKDNITIIAIKMAGYKVEDRPTKPSPRSKIALSHHR